MFHAVPSSMITLTMKVQSIIRPSALIVENHYRWRLSNDLVAFIRSKGQLYEANSVEELEALVGQMKKGEEGG